jgi:hypothetical protein
VPHVKDYKQYTKISRALNSTFGDQGPGEARVSTQKVNLNLVDEDVLKASFVSTVTFPHSKVIEQLTQKHRKEGVSMIEGALERAKANFEKLFPEDKSISFKLRMDTCQDVVEFITPNQTSPVLRALFKMTCLVEIK